MASLKTTICFVIATAFVVSASAGGGSLCNGADDKVLCKQLTGGAKSWQDAMTNAINGVMVKAKAGKSVPDIVASKLPANLHPNSRKSITGTCQMAYDNIIDNLKECLGFLKSDPYSSLKSYLSATTFSDCTDGLEEFGFNVPEASQFGNEILKLSGTLLAVADNQ